jgi:hypothetical protein
MMSATGTAVPTLAAATFAVLPLPDPAVQLLSEKLNIALF